MFKDDGSVCLRLQTSSDTSNIRLKTLVRYGKAYFCPAEFMKLKKIHFGFINRWVLNLVKKVISAREDLIYILVFILMIFQLGKGVFTQRMKSSCVDEPLHIQVGLNFWREQDHGYGFTNPTLPERIIALPQVLLTPDNTAPHLELGKIPVFATMLILGVVIFAWVRARAGNVAALIALILYTFCPNILAHGSIAGTDLMAGAAFFISLICYIALIRRVTLIHLVATGSALGVLFTTKLIAFFILPTFLVLGIFRSTDPWSLHFFKRSITQKWQKSLALIGVVLILGVCIIGAIWAVYGFEFRDSWGDKVFSSGEMGAHRMSTSILNWASRHRVMPEGYLLAVDMMLTAKNTGYLRGETSYEGWWWYFPYALLVKTPIPTLICFLFGFGVGVVQLTRLRGELSANMPQNALEWIGLTLSAFFYMGIVMISSYNVGIRLILAMYPCLISLVGLSIPYLKKSKIFRYAICVLLAWLLFTFVYQSRDPLAYFNEFAGGSKNGYKHLVDSNLDWGQDLPLLAQYLQKREDQEVWLQYFGSVHPSSYNIDSRQIVMPYAEPQSTDVLLDPLSGGLYVVSLTHLFGGYILDTPDFYPLDIKRWMSLHRKISLHTKGFQEPESQKLYQTTYGASPTKEERIMLRGFQGVALLNRLKQIDPYDRIGYTMFVYQLTNEEVAHLTSP